MDCFLILQLLSVLIDPDNNTLSKLVEDEAVDQVIVCSVSSDLSNFERETGLDQVTKLNPHLDIPIINKYHTPHTLGMDRLAVAAGANFLYPQEDCLVIDAGTTITYEFIDSGGNYLGGGISPGLDSRFRSLNQHTYQLPQVAASGSAVPLIGTDTESSIKSGVINGVIAEIEGIIRRYDEKFPNLKVVMCGGDAAFFDSKLKAPIFVNPHLVLIGLNSILLYHAQNK